jgi:hypothetical protein
MNRTRGCGISEKFFIAVCSARLLRGNMACLTDDELKNLPPTTHVLEIGCGQKKLILKPGGLLYVEVPHFSSHHFQTDPTHKIRFGVRTFDYFEPAQGGVYLFHYSYADFKKRRVIVNGSNRTWFHRWVTQIVNKHKLGWERDLAWVFPHDSINFELEVLKTRD